MTPEQIADVLGAMLQHTDRVRESEEDAYAGDLLEDLEARLGSLVRTLRGQEAESRPPHFPMPGEVDES